LKALIWTRSIDDWAQDEPLLKTRLPADISLIHIPCIQLEGASISLPAEESPTHFVFTSANAVDFSLRDEALKRAVQTSQGVYTHGESTYKALISQGIKATLVPGIRTAEALGGWLAAHAPKHGSFLLPGAEEPAFDLAAFLRTKGFKASALMCYRTRAMAHSPDGGPVTSSLREAVLNHHRKIVCFFSPSAVRGFIKVFARDVSTAVAIGPTTAESARPFFERVEVASESHIFKMIETAIKIL
jgi:uroporphyrinogen-III synthase